MSERNSEHSYNDWLLRLKTFGYRCFWCEKPVTEVTAHKDHLQPLSRGGTDKITNIVPACMPCNSRKGMMNEEEYRAFLAKSGKKSTGVPLLGALQEVLEEAYRGSWAWKNPFHSK